LSRSERRAEDGDFVLFDYDQPHNLALALGYVLGSGWLASSTFRLVSGNPQTPVQSALYAVDDDQYLPIYGEPNSSRAALYHRLDVRVEKRFPVGSGSLTVYLDVQNVYNARHPEATAYSFDYRQTASLVGLPLLPVLGARGEL
jgi:hypothetical protein